MEDPRILSQSILNEFFESKRSLNIITAAAASSGNLDTNAVQRTLALSRDVVRWKGRLDYWIDSVLDRPIAKLDGKLKILLRSAAFELLMDDKVPDYAAIDSWVKIARQSIGEKVTGITNAVLRSLTKIDPSKPLNDSLSDRQLADWLSFPHWLVEKWIASHGKDTAISICNALNEPYRHTVRIYPKSLSTDEIISQCSNDGIQFDPIDSSERFFIVTSGFSALKKHELFLTGHISVQDRAAGLAVELLDPKPGETVLDVCAAPGTKAVYLAERMQGTGKILASDSNPKRAALGQNDLERHGFSIIDWSVRDAAADTFETADAILVDAPCTGTGVIGKHPDIKWRRTEKNVTEMADLQIRILKHISDFVKPGGRLVYSTCSLEPEENWNVVDAFLKLNPSFTLEMNTDDMNTSWIDKHGTLQTLPQRDNLDGMYAAKMIRS